MRIKDLSPDERPREKVIRYGASSLSNAELLAILLRTGSGDLNAIDLARGLLSLSGGKLITLSTLSLNRMISSVKGIGKSKAITVAAAFELGKRFSLEGFENNNPTIRDSRSVYQMMRSFLLGKTDEQCWALGLDSGKRLLFREMVSAGNFCSTTFNDRKIVQLALENNAHGVIIVHNHPSGNPRPSPDDIERTRTISYLLRGFGIMLLDHVVFCDGSYFSFADEVVSMEEMDLPHQKK